MGGVIVDVQVMAATDGDPVLFDISQLDQYLLDMKDNFMSGKLQIAYLLKWQLPASLF